MTELTPIERLAVAQAFIGAVGDMTKTNRADNLRGEVDDYYRELYEQTGAKSFDVTLLGEKVGTYSLTIGKGKPQRKEWSFDVTDADALREWAAANDCLAVDMDKVRALFSLSGEVPDGCVPVETIVPEVAAGRIERSTLRIDSLKTLDVLQSANMLGDASAYLLEGGD